MPKIGDKITLNGRKVKSGAPYMNMTEKAQIILTDRGKEIFRTMNFGEPPAPVGEAIATRRHGGSGFSREPWHRSAAQLEGA